VLITTKSVVDNFFIASLFELLKNTPEGYTIILSSSKNISSIVSCIKEINFI